MLNKKVFLNYLLIVVGITHHVLFAKEHISWAEKTLATMSLPEKIGQLFVVATNPHGSTNNTEQLASSAYRSSYDLSIKHAEEMIKNYHIGGLIFLHKSDPKTLHQQVIHYQHMSSVPLLICIDAEWGLSMRLNKDPNEVIQYPKQITLAAIQDETIRYKVAHEIGLQCKSLGIDMNLAPVADVVKDSRNSSIAYRSFGDNARHVAHCVQSYIKGLQDAGLLACAKHFPGHGNTIKDSHTCLPTIYANTNELIKSDFIPFNAAITSDVDAIMTGHLAVPALSGNNNCPASLSKQVIQETLYSKLGFKGLIITDGLGMKAVTNYLEPGAIELQAVLAGNDIILCPLNVPRAVQLITQALAKGTLCQSDLDQRVLKILKTKERIIKNRSLNKEKIDAPFSEFIIRKNARDLQKQAYQAAITLVSNDKNTLFTKQKIARSSIVQVGTLPENIFKSLLKPTYDYVEISAQVNQEEFNACVAHVSNHDRIIIAIAEMSRNTYNNFGIADNLLKLITYLIKEKKEVIITLFGLPYALQLFNHETAVLIAYEDIPAAQEAAARILLGTQKAIGKLPIN